MIKTFKSNIPSNNIFFKAVNINKNPNEYLQPWIPCISSASQQRDDGPTGRSHPAAGRRRPVETGPNESPLRRSVPGMQQSCDQQGYHGEGQLRQHMLLRYLRFGGLLFWLHTLVLRLFQRCWAPLPGL